MKNQTVDSQGRARPAASGVLRLVLAGFLLTAMMVLGACMGSGDDDGGSGELPTTDAASLGEPVPPLRVLGPSPGYDPAESESMQLVVEGMRELGMDVEYRGFPDFTSLADSVGANDFEDFDIGAAGYLGNVDRLEPSALLTPTFTCDYVDDSNWSGYCNEEYDELLAEASAELDEDGRIELIGELQTKLAEDLPMLVLFHPIAPAIYNSSDISDPVLSPAAGYMHFENFHQANPADGAIQMGVSEAGQPLNPLCNEGVYFETYEYQGLIYDRLTRVNATGEPQPWMAESIDRPDDTTVVVTLRDDLEFSNGEPVTADDVKFTYDYAKEWEVGYLAQGLKHVKSVSTMGDDRLRFELADPYAAIESELFARVGILPQEIWEDVVEREGLQSPCDYQDHDFIGSGPYTLDYYEPAQGIRLVRNDDYFDPGQAEEIIGRTYASQQSLFQDLLAGSIDFTDSDPGLTPSQISQAEGDENLTVDDVSTLTVRFMSFNMREGSVFRDHTLRDAVAHMVDYDQIVGGILAGRGEAGGGIIAPANEKWHNPDVAFPTYDPEAAQEILADAGFGWDESGLLHYPANYRPDEFASGDEAG